MFSIRRKPPSSKVFSWISEPLFLRTLAQRWDRLENRERIGSSFFNAYIYWHFSNAFVFITTTDSLPSWMVLCLLMYNGRHICVVLLSFTSVRTWVGIIRSDWFVFFLFSRDMCFKSRVCMWSVPQCATAGLKSDEMIERMCPIRSSWRHADPSARFDRCNVITRVSFTLLGFRRFRCRWFCYFETRYGPEFLLWSIGRNRAARWPGILGPPGV